MLHTLGDYKAGKCHIEFSTLGCDMHHWKSLPSLECMRRGINLEQIHLATLLDQLLTQGSWWCPTHLCGAISAGSPMNLFVIQTREKLASRFGKSPQPTWNPSASIKAPLTVTIGLECRVACKTLGTSLLLGVKAQGPCCDLHLQDSLTIAKAFSVLDKLVWKPQLFKSRLLAGTTTFPGLPNVFLIFTSVMIKHSCSTYTLGNGHSWTLSYLFPMLHDAGQGVPRTGY